MKITISDWSKKHSLNWKEEFCELANQQYDFTGYPEPGRKLSLSLENFSTPMEEAYYFVLNHFRHSLGFGVVTKVSDLATASESSSFFGHMGQRLGIQQDKVSQNMATIGKMVKELFQMVHDLRKYDEKLDYYRQSAKGQEAAEIVLKGAWIDLVEGGSKNPGSVYGLAQNLQFQTLPNLFFGTTVLHSEDVDAAVDKLKGKFNKSVRDVLKRKLKQFAIWKKRTYEENKSRRKFTLQYLRQHWNAIQMYMAWVKPYLRAVKRLTMSDRSHSPDIINAFETSMIEIELIFRQHNSGDGIGPTILVTFTYTTRPEMNFQQEYQRGATHSGKLEINFRSYAWDKKAVDAYIKLREKEDYELLGEFDGGLKDAMESMGGEIEAYLEEAGATLDFKGKLDQDEYKLHKLAQTLVDNKIAKDIDEGLKKAQDMIDKDINVLAEKIYQESRKKFEKTNTGLLTRAQCRLKAREQLEKQKKIAPQKTPGVLDPFVSIFTGFYELFKPLLPIDSLMNYNKTKFAAKDAATKSNKDKELEQKSLDVATKMMSVCYKNFKKSHKMIHW